MLAIHDIQGCGLSDTLKYLRKEREARDVAPTGSWPNASEQAPRLIPDNTRGENR